MYYKKDLLKDSFCLPYFLYHKKELMSYNSKNKKLILQESLFKHGVERVKECLKKQNKKK